MSKLAPETAIGARIRAIRTGTGLTQAAVAERAGLVFETVSRIERGVISPTVGTLVGIARALGVGLPDLVDVDAGVPQSQVLDETLAAVIEPLRDQPQKVREQAARVVRALVQSG